MTSNSQNISCYSSLIGFFYQHGIGCEIDKIKAFEIFSNAVKNNNHKIKSNLFSFNQKNDDITFYNDDIKKLNEIIIKYFYSLFLYKDVILYRKDNYQLYIKDAEKGDVVLQYYIGNCYYYGINIDRDYNEAIEWYSKSSRGGNFKAIYKLSCCHDFGYGVKKDEKKAFELFLKSAKGGNYLALCMVGNCYYYGKGILKDENKAFEWYLKAAVKGENMFQKMKKKGFIGIEKLQCMVILMLNIN